MQMMTAADIRQLARDIRITWAVPVSPVWRCDIPRAIVSGRMQSWAERLNRAVFAARAWEGLETVERRFYRLLNERRIRCEVYEANNNH